MPRRFLPLLLLVLVPGWATAQDEPVEIPPSRTGLDADLFYVVYENDSPFFEAWMRSANNIASPTFAGAVPVHGLAVLAADESGGPVGRMALSELGTLGMVFVGKTLIRRARPFRALPGVAPRQRRPPSGLDPFSFPSGHSALAFTIATSLSLSYPEWYVVVPAYTWATSTAMARIWFGMHYPSDTVVGAAVGTGVAVLVHVLLHEEEEVLSETALPSGTPVFSFQIPLN